MTKQAVIYNMFFHFCKEMGKKVSVSAPTLKNVNKKFGDNWKDSDLFVPYGIVGAWTLCYAPVYGGWQIQETCENGGIDCPLGYRRFKNKEFLDRIQFAYTTLYYIKWEKQREKSIQGEI